MSGRVDAQAGEMPGCARPFGYVPRQTHECDAAVPVRRHLAKFLERCEERAGPLPAFVKGELVSGARPRCLAMCGVCAGHLDDTARSAARRGGRRSGAGGG